MSTDVKEHLYKCWRKGLSLGESVRSVKTKLGADIGSSDVQAEFARLSAAYH